MDQSYLSRANSVKLYVNKMFKLMPANNMPHISPPPPPPHCLQQHSGAGLSILITSNLLPETWAPARRLKRKRSHPIKVRSDLAIVILRTPLPHLVPPRKPKSHLQIWMLCKYKLTNARPQKAILGYSSLRTCKC